MFLVGFLHERWADKERLQSFEESSVQASETFSQLIAAYDQRLNTVQGLTNYALKHQISVPSSLISALKDLDGRPTVAATDVDSERLTVYQAQQASLDNSARELIALIDSELPAMDNEFVTLYREFETQDQRLQRIQSTYVQQARRTRSLARRMRLPASLKNKANRAGQRST